MTLSKRIKYECFCAFIHTRLSESANANNGTVIINNEYLEILKSYETYLIQYFGNIKTFNNINNIIKSNKSVLLCNMYTLNYKYLLELYDKYLTKDEYIISSCIALAMIVDYLEYNDINIDIDILYNSYDIYEKQHANKDLIVKMFKIGTKINTKYWSKK